jgi:cyclophilin family peptidyl-prolyl cis-trans isomerase
MFSSKLQILFFLFLLIFSCAEKPSKKKSQEIKERITVKTEIKKPVKKKIKQEKDTLHAENTNSFFTEYGKQNKETKILITTDFGEIKLRLYEDTPIHRASFIFLAKNNYFNTTVFYRVSKDFVIQGGNSDDEYTVIQRRKYDNYLLDPEFRNNRTHTYGALAAAKDWENNPNNLSSPFEFYIVQNKTGAHHLDNEHTVFGEVISGFETIEKINEVETGSDEWPVSDIGMKVKIL